MARTVAVLCAARRSVYKTLEDVDVYDIDRDALSFPGGMPIIAHPPCRAWSAYCGHQAKPLPGEKELGIWCCRMLLECGGVLEQPAHSRLFAAGGLPLPGEKHPFAWSAHVWQRWWGCPVKKATWLCFARVQPQAVEFPLVLHNPKYDRRQWNRLSKDKRAATCRQFAEWLVEVARLARV